MSRSLHTDTLQEIAGRLDTPEGRAMRDARWVGCEGTFARLNGLLHWGRCRMWDRLGAEMELYWRQFIHNLLILTGVWRPLVAKSQAA